MCCFSMAVESVSQTQIFARLSGPETQVLAYRMKYSSSNAGAMILPLPTPPNSPEDSVRFISLEKYKHFFSKLNRGFPRLRLTVDSKAGALPASAEALKLKVVQVGDFIASFVPTMDDFDRLDPQFVIPKSNWDKIPEYADYGFAVFQLTKGEGKTHPMALEFPTRMPEKVFFPTVHIHDGEVHREEQFDHTLYAQNPELDSRVGSYQGPDAKDPTTGFVRSQEIASEFVSASLSQGLVDPNLLVHRKSMQGMLANQDQFIDVAALAALPTHNASLFRNIGPIALLAGVAAWFLSRRQRLRYSNRSNNPL